LGRLGRRRRRGRRLVNAPQLTLIPGEEVSCMAKKKGKKGKKKEKM
jgi:hypothetical protein